jgi:peptidoglycan hydrolase CwlO-like protein
MVASRRRVDLTVPARGVQETLSPADVVEVRPNARRALRSLAAALLTAGAIAGASPLARADTPGDAQARVRALLDRVHAVQAQARRAETRYDASLAGVAASVTAQLQTQRAQTEVDNAAQAARDALDARVRGLYESGGPLAVYASLLESGSVTDLQNGVVLVGSVVAADGHVVRADAAVLARARASARAAARQATRSIRTERDVAKAAQRVQALLREQRDLLAQARAEAARVQDLAAAQAALAAQAAAFDSITTTRVAELQVLPGSPAYMALYHRAATTCPGLSWTVLAAIGQVESGHGRNVSTSYAGAMGPMQFLPRTFAAYAVDGDGDGRADIMDPADAVYTAARYLCANGAGAGGAAVARAVWHYNHAAWYVQMVLTLAQRYAAT